MRTKALLGLAALAAGAMTAAAQSSVYSLNVVGYYNVPVPANQLVMLANQLNTTNNKISSLLPSVPAGAQLYKYNGGYTVYQMDEFDPVWLPDGNATLNPGEGAFFRSPTATTLTFVGEVLQGSLTNTLPIGALSMRSSMVPQAGTASALGIPGEAGDQLYKYSNGYTVYQFDEFDPVWIPSEPSLNVGEAFFYRKSPTSTKNNWVRDFTVQ
jgi:hypothetical protein